MKKEEKIAYDYLVSSGHKNIIYEPHGHIPPDFSIDGSIGVEVRRLNQNLFKRKKVKGLEQDRIRLLRGVRSVLREFDERNPVKAYWIVIDYYRPLGNLSKIKNEIRKELKSFLINNPTTPFVKKITSTFTITIARAQKENIQRFRVGIESDLDSGGFIIPMYKDNIEYCSQEKAMKIQYYINNFVSWWLILVDMLPGISTQDISKLVLDSSTSAVWEKIIIVNPITKKKTFEL